MIIIYETRSFSEARTMDAFRYLVYAATALFIVMYSGLFALSYFVLFFIITFFICLLLFLISFFIQLFRRRLKPTAWKIDIENNSIKQGIIPYKYTFKSIDAFFVSKSNTYVEFIMNRKYYRIWKSKIDHNEYLFESFVEALKDSSKHSYVPLEIPTLGETRRKAVFYSFTPYIVVYIGVMILSPSTYDFLRDGNHMVSSFILPYMIIAIVTTRIFFVMNINKVLKKDK